LRILIADDDAGVRAVLVAALESGDHDVEAISLPSAVAARGDLAEFDAVILDAGGGGVEALRALRGRGERVPVLLASGDIVDAKGDDRTRTLLKPFALGSLEATLRELSALRPRG
jgi:DNA-binding response OmpR family regulator